MKRELFYIPNVLSIIRFLLIIPCCYLLLYKYELYRGLIIIILILMFLTDILDGYIARRFNQVTEAGKVIDPVADKLAVISIAIILYIKGFIAGWFFWIVLLRDLLIMLFGLYINKKYKTVLMSNYAGKSAVLFIGIILLLSVIDNEMLNNKFIVLYYVTLVLILISSYLYLIRFFKIKEDIKNE